MKKEAGLRAQRGTLPSISQHSTIHADWTHCEERAGLRVQHGTLPSISQHSTIHGDWTDSLWGVISSDGDNHNKEIIICEE